MLPLRNVFVSALPLSPVMSTLGQTFFFNKPSAVAVRAFFPSGMMNMGRRERRIFSSKDDDSGSIQDEENDRHRMAYSVRGTSCGSVMTSDSKRGHTMITDLPKNLGGTDIGPTPIEMLLAALIGCEQSTAVFVGRSMNPRILIHRIDFDITLYRDKRGALQFPIDSTPDIAARPQKCFGTATVFLHQEKEGGTAILSPDQLALLKEQTEARCPIANMMEASGCEMNISWINGSTTVEKQK